MVVTIKGIRVDNVTIERDEGNGSVSIKNAQYSLISSTDHVLAKQPVGCYGGLTLKPSSQTSKALDTFMQSYKSDVLSVLGLDLE